MGKTTVLRALIAALTLSLAIPASAFASETTEEKVTQTMFILILALLAVLTIVAIIEAKRQK